MIRYYLIIIVLLSVIMTSCEEEYIPEIADSEPEIVVEGYIEAGPNATPPYVLLTRSTSFFSSIDASQVNNLFVHDAIVRITNETDTIVLEELCLSSLTPIQQELVAGLLGLGGTIDSVGIDICAYVEPTFAPQLGEVGKRYDLEIEVGEERLTASTTIPSAAPLDSIRYAPHPTTDSLVELRCFISDPVGVDNFYRYFTQRNSEPFYPPPSSVFPDEIFSGESFELPLARGQVVNTPEDFDPDTFGFFWKGDTITVKWCALDEAHYDFWSTLEYNSGSEGPFASFTRVKSNINGGLGIWGGYSASYHSLIVPE